MKRGAKFAMQEYLKKNAERFPDKAAVRCGDDVITFSQLYKRAEEEAEILKADRKKLFIIKNERSIKTIIKILATVFINRTYRIVDDISEALAEKETVRICKTGYTYYAPMYEIATSGTTGQRKIIEKEEMFLVEFIRDNYIPLMKITSDDIILNQLEFTFDAATKDIFTMVIAGSTLCIGSREKMNFPIGFIEEVKKYKATLFLTTPYFIKSMAKIKAFENEIPETLRMVLFVGDVLKSEYLNYWIEKMSGVTFINLYGASEDYGNLMYFKTKKKVSCEYVPLNKVIREADWYAGVDENGNLYVESTCRYRRYTEDLARIMSKEEAGCPGKTIINIIGRIDNVRKIRGYRIALEEIERGICQVQGIVEALCEIKEDEIYALLETDEENCVKTEKEITGLIADKLPAYCRPVHIRIVKELPVNANGKRDRKQIADFFG